VTTELPSVGPPSPVSFPAVDRRVLDNGLRLWSMPHAQVPAVTIAIVVDGGTAADPSDRPGLTSLVAGLMTEGAGALDAIAMADAVARIGGHLAVDPGADVVTMTLTTLTRHFEMGLGLLADILRRPRLAESDFARVRDLRLSRLTQASRSAGTVADRAILAAVFGDHPYGHGALGTSRAVNAVTLEEARAQWERTWGPARATMVVAGDIDAERAWSGANEAFGDWDATLPPPSPLAAPSQPADRRVHVLNRPGAPQTEVRVGHLGPPRLTPDYHALLALNALLGGQFTSRINRNLREVRAITYGARSSFEMRRAGGLFSCDTSVQADAVLVAAAEILRECLDVTNQVIGDDELVHAKASLTRGYVRHFETAAQMARALTQVVTYALPFDTYDRFVPAIESLTADDLIQAARASLRPGAASVVVVGDLERIGASLASLDRDVVEATVEF